ncbi:hypothetical protein PR202_ga04074 [Eleusine coracana subsp. coracana]|uniref:EF-hand domain-containing protein n=1 Tax=Eleusine coracana subsp. coracana TaxID=191504 RepID=A0AAV5BQU1_ELECO|nr:hypothetical protein PR202_ga04074 [Eleusine coracana subsp. coracana]
MAGYPPPGSGYPYGPGSGYGAPPSYGSSAAPSAPPYGQKPPKEGKTSSSSSSSSAPYYGAPPTSQPQPYGGSGSGSGGYGGQQYGSSYGAPPGGQQYGSSYGAPPHSSSAPPYGTPPPPASSAPYGAPGGYGSPFAAAGAVGVPARDRPQRRGLLPGGRPRRERDDRRQGPAGRAVRVQPELQPPHRPPPHVPLHQHQRPQDRSVVGRYSFVYWPKEFIDVFYSLQNWRSIFERFDRDRSGKIDASELRDALLSLGYSVSPTVLDLLVSKFDKTGGKSRAIEYDNFIECCLTVKGLTEKFKEKDTAFSGSATFTYEAFMLTVLPFLIA